VLYPVVDIDLTEEHDGTFDGVMELSHILRGSWSINPQYYPQEKKALAERLILPGAQLEHWENWFCYNDCNLEAEGFYLRRPVSVPPQPARAGGDAATEKDSAAAGFTLLSDFWEGRVELWAVSPDGMERFLDGTDLRTTPDAQPAPPQRPEGTWTRSAPQSAADRPTSGKRTPRAAGSRPVLDTALVAAVEYLLRSRRSKPESPMPRSMHLFYDYDARTFRQKSWLWTMGPAVSALLRAAERPAVAERFGIDTLHRAAREMADQTLAYQVDDPEHPADGILMCRYDFDQESSELYEAKYSPADSLFFVGWALLPLYAAGGERRYLDASVRMV
jgi:hypothetical protein